MKHIASHFLGTQRNGVNHVSMNLGDFPATGPVRNTNYPTYTDALLDWYKTKNMKSVRLMFTWEAVQSAASGPVPPAQAGYANYWTDLTGVVTRLLARDIYVILSPWQYNSVSQDTDILYKNAPFTPAQFEDFWSKFATALNLVTGNDQRVAFDLINEPHTQNAGRPGDQGITLANWFLCAQAAITRMRNDGVTNTIFVPGMNYAAASVFTSNGSSVAFEALNDPLKNIAVTVHCYTGLGSSIGTVLPDACVAVVTWARDKGFKVNVGEIAINAGPNGRPVACGTLAKAHEQWDNWNTFCIENSDVLVGWNWWGNSAGDTPGSSWWNQGDQCDATSGFHWGLTLNDGVTQTVYMNLIESTVPAPNLVIHDNLADAGVEPNPTTSRGWESLDIWVTQAGSVGGVITGGMPSVVNVLVTNNGNGVYPGNAGHVVRLYWAKAETGLAWPDPWDGTLPGPPPQGDRLLPPIALGTLPPGQTQTVSFPWPNTPNPADYINNDGHFCLLAFVTPAASSEFDGFQDPDLNVEVLKYNDIAWRNIHLVALAEMKMGNAVVANHTRRDMHAQLAFEILDENARPMDPAGGKLLVTPTGAALDKLREYGNDRPYLEDLGHGTFRVLDIAAGIPRLDLRPGEVVVLELSYVPSREAKGYAVRAIQSAHDGGVAKPIGGQTFVVGYVEGFTRYERSTTTAS